MFGFRRKASDSDEPGARDRLATLSGRIDDVEAGLRKLHAEWLDTYERLNRLVGRLVKRAERDALAAAEPEATPDATAPGAPPNGVSFAMEQVQKRRNRTAWTARGGSR